MDEFSIVIMLKDIETGILEKELGSYKIEGNENLILNVYAQEDKSSDNDSYICYMKVSTDKELQDWEFEAVYDYYDTDVYGEEIIGIKEVEECFNPTWEICFAFKDDIDTMEEKISHLLKIHDEELKSVYEEIGDKEDEYK